MLDREWCRALLDPGDGAERHLSAIGGRNEHARQRGRVALELLHGLQHDPVLIGLSVDGGDLSLAEGIVEGVVDGLHRDAEAAGRFPIDLDEGAQPPVLGLGDHVAQEGRHAQLFNQARGP